MRLQCYEFKLVHKAETVIPVADALTTAYLPGSGETVPIFTVPTEEVITSQLVTDPRIIQIR